MGLQTTFKGILDTVRVCVPTLADAALGRLTLDRCDERLDWWAHKVLHDADIDLIVRGQEHAEGTQPFVVMSNHQSFYDIPVVYRAIPGRLRMIAKQELFRVPVFGRTIEVAGFIRVNRQDREQAVTSLRAAATMLREGTRIWIAPEGTRSATGALGPFKSGGFRMAIETGTPILPVAIDGTRLVLPARRYVVQEHHRVVLTILPPVDPKPYGLEGRKALMDEVRTSIARALGQDPRASAALSSAPRSGVPG
jgi:1-acyl-sn-glycerol-3-phosphate acyltransferase